MKTNPISDEDRATRREQTILSLGAQLSALMSSARGLTADAATEFHSQLPPAAFQIAQWLHAFGPAKSSRIAMAVAMDRSATSRLTRKLIQAGMIETRSDPADGRGVVLSLTDQGRKKMRKANKLKTDVFCHRLHAWSEADVALFTRLLRRFNCDI